MMVRRSLIKFVFCVLIAVNAAAFAQPIGSPQNKSQEVSEIDGIPVLIKHLPNWENVRDRTTFAQDGSTLKTVLGQRPILDLIDFSAGTEAVTATYDDGKLLIIEYSTPQASVDADGKFTGKLAEMGESGLTLYRRIGNYNVFVFDAVDEPSANALLNEVKYEKNVQWLDKDPFLLHRAERAFIISASNLFISTVLFIVMGIGVSIFSGIVLGFVFFRFRERKRATMTTFTDAGGMTRLNLDGFTPEIVPKRLLKD